MSSIGGVRHDFIRNVDAQTEYGVVERPLTVWEKIWDVGAVRKMVILISLAAVWEIYGRWLNNPLMVPAFSTVLEAFFDNTASGELVERSWYSIRVLLTGYAIGIVLAAILAILAIGSRFGNDFLETMTSMLNPLPAIALLPLALLWFGLGNASIVFVLVHSVLWPVALNTHSGFMAVSTTLRMVGHNAGLRGIRYVLKILIPAAFGSILTGLKIGWAFSWRTLIAAELVFGVNSGSGGLGWFIYLSKNDLEIANVFAGLLSVIAIGFFVENLVFRNIEAKTIKKWGMHV